MKAINVSILMLITGIIVFGGIKLTDENAYYCQSRNLVVQCNRLSSTEKTCYSNEGSKICTEGWQKIVNDIQINKPKQWKCNNIKCVEFK